MAKMGQLVDEKSFDVIEGDIFTKANYVCWNTCYLHFYFMNKITKYILRIFLLTD